MNRCERWAREEFGDAVLDDERRVARLVTLAGDAAARPAGTVTRVCRSSAGREGAFRWLENRDIATEPVAAASHRASLRRCGTDAVVYVPIDGTTLTLTDTMDRKELGGVGTWSQRARGVQVVSALAVRLDGTPLGVCGQSMWLRAHRVHVRHIARSGDLANRETGHLVRLLWRTNDAFIAQAPGTKPWFQIDRGGDCWPILGLAQMKEMLLTVRAAHDRCLRDEQHRYLWKKVMSRPVIGHHKVDVPARPARTKHGGHPAQPARSAKLSLRVARVCIEASTEGMGKVLIDVNAVLAREVGHKGDALEWMLLTTHPVKNVADAVAVLAGYTQRWRIEEFHRTWKRGLCRVEDTQLRSREAIFKWATILGAVASRAMRLAHLGRNSSQSPATEELSAEEIDALIVLRKPPRIARGYAPTMGEAVRWLAELGGYTGKSSGGPPGATVIGRGLQDLAVVTEALKNLNKM